MSDLGIHGLHGLVGRGVAGLVLESGDVNVWTGKVIAHLAGLNADDYADVDAVVDSETAMDAVAVSSTARDAVESSDIARDLVFASNMAIGKLVVGHAGLDPSPYADMDAVADSETAMDAVADSETAMDAVVDSETAMDEVVASSTAMDEVAASSTARDAIGFSGMAYDEVAASNMAIGKLVAGHADLDPTDYADMDAVAASETAMDAVAASETAMDAVVPSETAMDAVAASVAALTALLASQYAEGTVWGGTAPSQAIWEAQGNAFPLPGREWSIDLDFSHLHTLHVDRWKSESGAADQIIRVDGTVLWSDDSVDGVWETVSLDVTGYSGVQSLTFEIEDFTDELILLAPGEGDPDPRDGTVLGEDGNDNPGDRGSWYALRFD